MKGHWGCLTRLFLRAFVLSGSLLLFKILSPKDVFYNLPRLAAALAPGALHGQLRSLHGDMVTTAAPTAHFVMAMSSRKLVSTALSCLQRFEGRNSSGRAPRITSR